METEENTHTKS